MKPGPEPTAFELPPEVDAALAAACQSAGVPGSVPRSLIARVAELGALDRWSVVQPGVPAGIYAKPSKARTLLGTFCCVRNQEACHLLLSMGADPNAADSDGATPLIHCMGGIFPDIMRPVVRDLLERGALTETEQPRGPPPSAHGMRALHYAAARGAFETATLLLAHGAQVDAKDDGSRSPLHWAALSGWTRIVQLLDSHGADFKALGEPHGGGKALDAAGFCQRGMAAQIHLDQECLDWLLGRRARLCADEIAASLGIAGQGLAGPSPRM